MFYLFKKNFFSFIERPGTAGRFHNHSLSSDFPSKDHFFKGTEIKIQFLQLKQT